MVEPCGVTAPTSGAMETLVASVVVQESLTDSPLIDGSAIRINARGGLNGGRWRSIRRRSGGGGVFLLQPATKKARAEAK